MKFSTREDIEAPIDFVFAQVSDFPAFERRALRQGAEVGRRDTAPIGAGAVWDIAFRFRGRPRQVVATLARFEAPTVMVIDSATEGLDVVTEVDLIALSQTRTRVMVSFEMKARSLTARLLLQSLRLARAKITKRFKARVLEFAEQIEDRYRRDG